MENLNYTVKVGLTVVIALVLAFIAWNLVSNKVFAGGKGYDVHVRFDDATGVKRNMPIKLGGKNIGYVKELKLVVLDENGELIDTTGLSNAKVMELMDDPGNEAVPEVDALIYHDIILYSDYILELGQEGLLGESYLAIRKPPKELRDPDYYRIDDGDTIQGTTEGGITALIADARGIMETVDEKIDEVLGPEVLGGLVEELRLALEKVNGLLDSTSGLIDDNGVYVASTLRNVEAMSENFLSMSQHLDTTSAEFESLMTDPKRKQELEEIMANMVEISQNIDDITAEVHNLISDPGMQQDAKDSVRLIKETLEESKATMQRFQQTLDGVDGLMDDAGGLMSDAGGAISEARSTMNQVRNFGDAVDVKMDMTIRAVDKDDDQSLGNEDIYVGDLNMAVGFNDAYVKFGAENIGEENDANLLFGYGALDGFSIQGGVYRSELGIGAAYYTPGGWGVQGMWYDTEDPKINSYLSVPVGDSVNVVLGAEDIENNAQASVGINVELGN